MPIPNPEGANPGRGGPTGEFAAIERLRARFEETARSLEPGMGVPPNGEVWIGDDAAVVTGEPAGGGRLLLATDLLVEGIHFDLAHGTVGDAGYKALVSTVSDLAAMGARPRHALDSVAGPRGTDLDGLAAGLADAAIDTGCRIVGGDLSQAPVLIVCVAVIGFMPSGPGGPLLRSTARPGDRLFVTGPLGRSAAGLAALSGPSDPTRPRVGERVTDGLVRAYLRPRARVEEGVVARLSGARACIDVSDGLAADVRRLASASGVGLDLADIPVAEGATRRQALHGGEDYELIVATGDPDRLSAAFEDAGLRAPLPIGRATSTPEETTLRGEPLPEGGWEHQF